MKRGDSLTDNSGSFGIYLYTTVRPQKAVAAVSRGSHSTYSGNRGYASWRSLTPAYVLSPAGAGSKYGSLRSLWDKCFFTAFGRVKSGLKPAVKNRAAHGGEDCAARRVKTKADALGIDGQAPIYPSK